MKILCFILSFFVLSFSSVDCCADDKCNDEVKTEQTNNHSTNHQHSTDCNTCSPFFTCGSCSGFVFSGFKLDFDKSFVVKDVSPTLYVSHFPENISAEIWQPPKLS